MGRFTDYLRDLLPRTGKVICESGTTENQGDKLRDDRFVSDLLQVEAGHVYQADFRGSIPAGGTLYFGQPVNTERMTGIRLSAIFAGGPVEFTQYAGATPGTELSDLGAVNADRRITTPGPNPVKQYDGLTDNGRQIESDFGLTPTTGTGRGTAALSSAGIGGIYDAATAPFFSFQNTGSTTAQISIRWVWRDNSPVE